MLPEPPPQRLGDLEAERERERQRAAEIQASYAEIEAAERREAAQRHDRAERRPNHRLHLPRVESNANRKEVKRYLKSRGIGPQELTPQVRQAFKRQFAV